MTCKQVQRQEVEEMQGGSRIGLAAGPLGSPARNRVDFEETATQFLTIGTR
jgi:hypothetical protein